MAGDINGDGRRDLVVLAQRQVRAFSQREGTSSLSQFHSYEVAASEVLLELTSAGDSNGDRYADLVFSVAGQAGRQRHVRLHGQARATRSGRALARGCAGGYTGDGIGDLLLSDEASGQLVTRVVAGPASYVFAGGFESGEAGQLP
ncbi:MAG: VCBS repeat-containing protein [Rhodanobacteraceae bacterium]|nr:VCBS repeat-containing protein [Rhodanobacteraceae bacterium]